MEVHGAVRLVRAVIKTLETSRVRRLTATGDDQPFVFAHPVSWTAHPPRCLLLSLDTLWTVSTSLPSERASPGVSLRHRKGCR